MFVVINFIFSWYVYLLFIQLSTISLGYFQAVLQSFIYILVIISILLTLSPLFSMAGCDEKFPDDWELEFFWTIIVEYISHDRPVDVLVKRFVTLFFNF